MPLKMASINAEESQELRRTSRYVEGSKRARTKLGSFFSIIPNRLLKMVFSKVANNQDAEAYVSVR